MSMQGIDIASWQAGIDLSAVPADFVIVKATQGTGYVNPDFHRAIAQADAAGKCLGIYHYISGVGAAGEMDHFISEWQAYKGRAVPMLDWESEQNSAWQNEGYLEECVRAFVAKTGIPPVVYSSLSAMPWGVCARNDCGTWVAQYASMDDTGYRDSPWNEGAYTCTIRQYSSSGRLPGYGGRLDLNKAYIDRDGWERYANPGGGAKAPSPAHADKSTSQLADEVIAGRWGNGAERISRLRAAGYDAEAVQAEVNSRFSQKTVSQLADEVIAGKHGNGEERRASLGSKYDEVQAEVNRRLQATDIDSLARAVIRGDYGNGAQRRQKLGGLFDAVQRRVNELLG